VFNDCLFAPLGDDANGMTLSVVSALGRLGFDPWREAARLATLPAPQAVAVLAGLFDRLPGVAGRLDTVCHATRLIGLLPMPSSTDEAVSIVGRRLTRPRLGFGGICFVLVLATIAVALTNRSFFAHEDAPMAAISTPR
jgi:hypothetical protein